MSRRVLAAVVSAALISSALVSVATTVAVADDAPPSQPTGLTDATSAPDASSAAAIAEEFGHNVLINDETNETTSVSATPDGYMHLEANAEPVRVADGSGWTPTDLNLAASDGWVAPITTASPVRFSDGGSDTVAEVKTDSGQWVSESWPLGTVPTPTLDGDTATYASVLPGVDLHLTATPLGMSEVLVVDSEQAAANPSLSDLELSMGNADLSVTDQKNTVATAPDGSSIESAAPTWWDSAVSGASVEGPGGAGEAQPLSHTTTSDAVTLHIDDVTNSDVTYQLYVDPDWGTKAADAFWFTDRAFPDQSYLNGNQSAGYQSVGRANQNGYQYLSRAFWQFDVSAADGADIRSALFNVTWNYSCAATSVEYGRYGPSTPGFSWNSDPGTWQYTLGSFTPSSAAGCAASGNSGLDVIRAVSDVTAGNGLHVQLALRAANETDLSSRKHFTQNATLSVDYNNLPNRPSHLTIAAPQRTCGTGSTSAAYLNNGAQPLVVSFTQSDKDSTDNLDTHVQISKTSTLGDDAVDQLKTYSTPQGTQTVSFPKGTIPEGKYALRAYTNDHIGNGVWTDWCYFNVDNTPPPAPTFTTNYHDATIDGKATHSIGDSTRAAQVGDEVSVSVTADPKEPVRAFKYWVSSVGAGVNDTDPIDSLNYASDTTCASTEADTRYACTTNGSTATLTVHIQDISSSLFVQAVDLAGNTSDQTANYPIGGDDDPAFTEHKAGHGWSLPTAGSTTALADSNTAATNPLTLSLGKSLTTSTRDSVTDSSLSFTDPNGIILNYPDLVSINRYTGDYHSAVIDANTTSGSTTFQSHLGEIRRANGSAAPSHAIALYTCTVNGITFTTTSSTSCGTNLPHGDLLGYSWDDPTAVPGGTSNSVQVVRCLTSAGDHVDTTDVTCGNSTYERPLGWFAKQNGTMTSPVSGSVSEAVDTTQSFTVSAWLNPDIATGGPYTALSQDGTTDSAFYVQTVDAVKQDPAHPDDPTKTINYRAWRFCMRDQDSSRTLACVVTKSAVAVGKWTFVTGIWDAKAQEIRILTNAHIQDAYTALRSSSGDVASTGPFVVGNGKSNKAVTGDWNGQILDPTIYTGIASSDIIGYLFSHGTTTFNG